MKSKNKIRQAKNSPSLTRALVVLCACLSIIFIAGCGTASSGKSGGSGSGSGGGSNPGVAISPTGANVRIGATQSFSATVTGAPNNDVTWSVNDMVGGDATTGTINASGMYSAPATLPNPNSVTVKAVSTSDSSLSATAIVDVLNPIPAISGVQPSSINTGAFSLTVTGSNFVSGAQVDARGRSAHHIFRLVNAIDGHRQRSVARNFRRQRHESRSRQRQFRLREFAGERDDQSERVQRHEPRPGRQPERFPSRSRPTTRGTRISPARRSIQIPRPSSISSARASPCIRISARANINGSTIGIPYVVVGSGQPLVPIDFTAYGDESDPGPMPVPSDAPIEGYPNPGSGDRHVLVLDNSNCWLYELYSSYPNGDGSWNADSAAVWDLLNDEQRPYTWTSADAAGLSIFRRPGAL